MKIKLMKYTVILFILNLNAPMTHADELSVNSLKAYFFYEELCGNCYYDEENFISILKEQLPKTEDRKYPVYFETANIFETKGRAVYEEITDNLGIDRSMLETPLLILGGRVFQGYDSINANILEAYLTAAEDLYVNGTPYNPAARKTGDHLFDDFSINPDHVTVVYFYRITCPECNQTAPLIDSLPKSITVNNTQKTLDIMRLNTRSGNNNERIAAFFEAWNVPDKDRMVPIIFFSDSYLAGYNDISADLEKRLIADQRSWKLLPLAGF